MVLAFVCTLLQNCRSESFNFLVLAVILRFLKKYEEKLPNDYKNLFQMLWILPLSDDTSSNSLQ